MRLKALCAGLIFTAGVGVSSQALAVTELNASVWFPDSQPLTKFGYLEWAKKVAEVSKGDLKIKVFTGNSLLTPNAHLSGLRDGIADITYHAGTYTPSDLPEDNVLAILGIGMSDQIATTFAVADFYLNDPDMRALWKKQGIVFMGAYASVPYNLICRRKVETLADLKGLKLRTPGPVHAEWAKLVGATPVNVPSSEMFTGLDKGQIDCAVNGANELKTRSLWDVAKYVNTVNQGPYFAGWLWAMNGAKWTSLNNTQRRILLDTISDSTVETEIAYIAAGVDALKESSKHGVTVSEPNAEMKKSMQDFAKEARKMAIKEGQTRFNLKNPEALIARFEATEAKWAKLLANVNRTDEKGLKAVLKKNLYDAIDVATHGR